MVDGALNTTTGLQENTLQGNVAEFLNLNKKSIYELQNQVFASDNYNFLEILNKQNSLDDPIFSNEKEFQFFQKRAEKNLFCTINLVDGYDRENSKSSCIKKVEKIGEPYQIAITFPKNFSQIKVKDIPILIKQMNAVSFRDALPEYASYKEISVYAVSLIRYLNDQGQTELATYYQDFFKSFNSDSGSLVVDEKIKSEFVGKYDFSVEGVKQQIELDLSFMLKKHLFESVFEGGTKMLYEYMKAPGSDKYGSLVESLKTEGDVLETARASGDKTEIAKAEKKLVEKIFEQVSQYEDFTSDFEKYSFPVDVLKTQEMLCLSKTVLVQGLLDHFGMNNGVVGVYKHIFNKVRLYNEKEYIIDATKNSRDDGFYLRKKNNSFVFYETGELIDTESIILGDLINNLVGKKGAYSSDDIMYLEFALKVNPKNFSVMVLLGYAYMDNNKLQEAYEIFKKADGILSKDANYSILFYEDIKNDIRNYIKQLEEDLKN